MPEEERLLRAQAWYSKLTVPAIVLTTVLGFLVMLGLNAALTSGSSHFLLFCEGRKRLESARAYQRIRHPSSSERGQDQLPADPHRLYRGLADTPSQTLTSSVFFRPAPRMDEAAYGVFARVLEGPRNEMMRGVRQGQWHDCPPDVRMGASSDPQLSAAGVCL